MTDIQKVPSARATDVFGLFRSVNEALRSGKSGGGRTEVFVFSDLINTAGNLKPVDLKNGKDAAKMAETVFSRLESGKMIKRLEPGNDVRFTIFNPDKNVVKGPYLEFWNQFLQLWGVRAEHIQWR